MDSVKIERFKKIARIISEASHLSETDLFILLAIMNNSSIKNSELAKMLDFKDGNSVAYHIRTLQKEGLIDRYTIVPNWKRIGLSTEFIVLVEAENEEQLLEIEKKHLIIIDEYASTQGEIVVRPTISGCIIVQDVYQCFGDKTMGIFIGRATSDQDAAVYTKNYLVNKYPGVKVSLLLNKYKTINNFFIDTHAIGKLKEFFQIQETNNSEDTLKELKDLTV